MIVPAEGIMSGKKASGRPTKRPEYDLPKTRGDKLDLPPLVEEVPVVPDHHTVVDLFCGAGGMSLGFESAGFRTVLGVDRDKVACQTFAANIPAKVVVQDLSEITDFRAFFAEQGVHQVTGIIGGPPCQGFSRVGMGRIRHRDRLKGYTEPQKDPRNYLYRQFLAAVEALNPLFFVMENVPDLARYEDEGILLVDRIKEMHEVRNYHVEYRILLASDFGVPQHRSRFFLVGLHDSLGKEVSWSNNEDAHKLYQTQTLRSAIGDLPIVLDGHLERCIPFEAMQDTWLRRWYRQGVPEGLERLLFDHLTRPHREDDKRVFRNMREGQRYIDVEEEERRYRSDIFLDKYRKLIWDEPSWTLTAHIRRDSYRYIHPNTEPPRTISLREAARIQSFPDHLRFCGHRSNAFAQIGNAVPPLLSRSVARHIMAQLPGEKETSDPLL